MTVEPLSRELSGAALVLFSGGQDSATCLTWALDTYARVETVAFDYGQKHSVELEIRERFLAEIRSARPEWRNRLGSDHRIALDLIGQLGSDRIPNAFGNSMIQVGTFTAGKKYLPGRNLLMLSLASVVAFRRDISSIVCGTSETEYSGYPDCQDMSIKATNIAINMSSGFDFKIITPLMKLDKAGVWNLAQEIGGAWLIELIVESTHTCYQGAREVRHEWGYGCGSCPACGLRANGWNNFRGLVSIG